MANDVFKTMVQILAESRQFMGGAYEDRGIKWQEYRHNINAEH
jgi:hypothetical protein